jgi:hypothetical protein
MITFFPLRSIMRSSNWQAAEKRPSAAFPSSFVVAAYVQVRLTSQDSGALHLRIFEQPGKVYFFSKLLKTGIMGAGS